ncbi:MAG: hypothetical protein QOI67_2062, partial [Gaiellaceae bacterium]|nr:hypothetical protein [Gaiellaceae bacterium]
RAELAEARDVWSDFSRTLTSLLQTEVEVNA